VASPITLPTSTGDLVIEVMPGTDTPERPWRLVLEAPRGFVALSRSQVRALRDELTEALRRDSAAEPAASRVVPDWPTVEKAAAHFPRARRGPR